MSLRLPTAPIATTTPSLGSSATLQNGDRFQPVASRQRSATTTPANTGMPTESSTAQNFAVGIAIGVVVMVIALVAFFVWKNWKKKRAEQTSSPSRTTLHATTTPSLIARIQSRLSVRSKSTPPSSPESQPSSPTSLRRFRSMLGRGSTDSGRTDVVPPTSRHTSFSAVAPAADHRKHVSIAMDVCADAAPGSAEESLYKVTYTTERVYADLDSSGPISNYEKRLSKSDSTLFDRESTLYMTKAVAVGTAGKDGAGLRHSGSSMPDLLALPGAPVGKTEGGYASLSSNVVARPPAASRRLSASKPRRHVPHNRASLPSTRFLHAAVQHRACAATETAQSAEDSGYTQARNTVTSAYQSLLKVQKSSPALLTRATTNHESVISVDHYEVNSPPTHIGVNSYISFSEGEPTRHGSTSSHSRSGSDTLPVDGGVAALLKQLSITSVTEEKDTVEPGAPATGSSSTGHGCKVAMAVAGPNEPKPQPGPKPPVPPPRRDSVLRSRVLQQSRQRLVSGDAPSSDAATKAHKEAYRRSLSCPDLLAAGQDPPGQEAHGPPQAPATDSGVDTSQSSSGHRLVFVDHIREYRTHMPACQKPSDDYWVDPANSSPHSSVSLSSSNHSSPLKSSLPRVRVTASQASTLPGSSRPPVPPKPDKKTTAAKSRTLGSHLATQPRRQQALSSTSSSDDTDVLASDLRPTVKHPVMNRLLSETSREYWILEDRDAAASSFDEGSSFGSPP